MDDLSGGQIDQPEIVEFTRLVEKRMRADANLGSIRVPRVLLGVPPSRVFRRDAPAAAGRGRVRSPGQRRQETRARNTPRLWRRPLPVDCE
jgi:hypothetical protein